MYQQIRTSQGHNCCNRNGAQQAVGAWSHYLLSEGRPCVVSVKEGFPEKKGVRQDGGQLANPRQQELRVLGRGNCLD